MSEQERTAKQLDDSEDESMSMGWSARWDAQALGEVRSKAKRQEPLELSEQPRVG